MLHELLVTLLMRCPPLPPGGEVVITLFGAVRVASHELFVHSGRTRASTPGDRASSRFNMFGAVRLRAVRAAAHELFVHSERIRAVTQGVYILICVVIIVMCQYFEI